MSTKTCKRCEETKPIDEFYTERVHYNKTLLTRTICKECTKAKSTNWRLENPAKRKAVALRHYKKIRLQAIAYYSNNTFKCACCGEAHIEFLSIDHIDGNGAEHRRTIKSTRALFNWLKRNKYPSGFQVLCMNCNCAKGRNKTCPHELERSGEYKPVGLDELIQQTRRGLQAQKLLTYKGKTQNIADWAREYDMPPYLLRQRIFRDEWSMHDALTKPAKKTRSKE